MSKPHVLLIDDDPDICFMLNYFLENKGFKVKSVEHGSAALAYLNQLSPKDRPDYIIMDWIMPKMNGKDFLKTIEAQKEDYARTSFIIMSGMEVERPLPDVGISQEVVMKPFGIDRIFNLLKARAGARLTA